MEKRKKGFVHTQTVHTCISIINKAVSDRLMVHFTSGCISSSTSVLVVPSPVLFVSSLLLLVIVMVHRRQLQENNMVL
jgi:hypothetical protein